MPGGQVLKGNIEIVQHLQNAAAKAALGVHHALFDGNQREILMSGDAGNHAAVLRRARQNHRAGMRRVVGVFDLRGNARHAHGEDAFLVQNRRAHVAQLAQLLIRHFPNAARVRHDARVGHQEAGNVCPVLIKLRVNRARDDRAGNIAAAAGERAHLAIREGAVKARNDRALVLFQLRAQHLVRPFRGEHAPPVEADELARVDEIPAETVRQQPPAQVLAPAGREVRRAVSRICEKVF